MVSTRTATARFGQRRHYRAGEKKGLLALYGNTGSMDSWFAFDYSYFPNGELTAVTETGNPVASMDMGTKWANSSALADLTNLRTAANAFSFAAGKVHLLGASMGGTTVLNWAKANPTLVQSITLLIPCLDIQDIYDNDRGNAGFAAQINTAHGGRPSDANNPADNPSSFTGLPIQCFYSSNDDITPASIPVAWAAAVGANVKLYNMGAQGHSWASPWSGAALADFIGAND